MNKKVLIFAVVGLISGSSIPFINQYLFSKPLDFSLNFGLIALILGACFSQTVKLHSNIFLSTFFVLVTFVLSGISYGCLLDLRFHTKQYLSFLPLEEILIPLAVSVFVYMFSIGYMALGKNIRIWILVTVAFAIPLFAVSFPILQLHLFVMPSYLVFATFIVITVDHLGKRKVANVIGNIAIIIGFYVALLFMTVFFAISTRSFSNTSVVLGIGVGSLIVPALGIILYISDRFSKRKDILEENTPVIDTTWILSSASLVSNYSIIASPVSIFNYLRSSDFFERIGILTKKQKETGSYLSIATFWIHFLFMIHYDINIHPGIIWGATTGIASFTLSYCFIVLNENSPS